MEGCFLRFYLHENQRCHRRLAWEWLLDQANKLGIRGGTAFRAMAGFGHHRQLQENHFFELAGAARELDMRASPYDLTGYGFSPVRVEEPAGRAEYARAQSELAHRAAALRRELLARCHILVRADRGGNRRGTPVCQPAADPQPPAPDGVICRA